MDENQIKAKNALKQFFTISNAAFTMMNNISEAMGYLPHQTTMQTLHQLALQELKKEDPNMAYIDDLLVQMDGLASKGDNKSTNSLQVSIPIIGKTSTPFKVPTTPKV